MKMENSVENEYHVIWHTLATNDNNALPALMCSITKEDKKILKNLFSILIFQKNVGSMSPNFHPEISIIVEGRASIRS